MKYWLPLVLWMVLIFGASTDLMSSRQTSRFIGPILRWFDPDVSTRTIRNVQLVVRKTAHIVEYAILAWLAWRVLARPVRSRPQTWRWSLAVAAWSIATLYAISDESHQHFISSRQGSVWDVLLDSFGAAIGLLILRWILNRRNRSPEIVLRRI
ncbi:MAG TPA: VanZ family protein [Methylomirabilota bacterium]|nr:VanZ family protein [Methylomirabilota bacterium]